MKYAEERPGFSTSVHSWKPCPPDRFAKLVHGYAATCCSEYGHAGLSMTACKLDRETTATIYYFPKRYPEHCGTGTPCLMTVATADGRTITFERIPSREYPGLPEVTGLPLPDGALRASSIRTDQLQTNSATVSSTQITGAAISGNTVAGNAATARGALRG